MEEASVDHGTDRLRFFFHALLLLLFPSFAFATTFGPINVTQQLENATLVVHGRIVGSSWVVEERQSKRPYTQWKLQIITQPKGEDLGKEVIIRQPGGELGSFGYHVAGSATFRGGEEVFVNLRHTDEPGVKEVLALASGKYTVETGADGKSFLRSGLGYVLRDQKGAAFTPESFAALAARVAEGKPTEGDKTVFVSKTISHDTETKLSPAHEASVKRAMKQEQPATPTPIPVQESLPPTEEKMGSPLWWIVTASGLALLSYWFFRKH
jgi:hypothetical protein